MIIGVTIALIFLDNNQNNFPIFEHAEDLQYKDIFESEEGMNSSNNQQLLDVNLSSIDAKD